MLLYIIVAITLLAIVLVPLFDHLVLRIRMLRDVIEREQALQIAEAGINYYQWRLAHFPKDYQDGTGRPGPYVHDYIDVDKQEKIGQFSLVITPPQVGSTVVTIQSTGWTLRKPNIKRTITVRYGIPSLTKYSFLSNVDIWIGEDEAVSGRFMSNGGIRFDGTTNAPVQSAQPDIPPGYICSPGQGDNCPAVKPGIWGYASDEVKKFWQFPVSRFDFSSLTSDLAEMKKTAQQGGIYLPPSNKYGYSLVFSNDGKVTIYRVDRLLSHGPWCDLSCGTETSTCCWNSQYTHYDRRVFQFTSDIPANGIIYAEDNVWVEGVVRGRATVVAAKLPYNFNTSPTIFIPQNIVYSQKDGSDSLGLIAQRSVVISYYAPSNLEINAAMVAQNGSVQFPYWPYLIKNRITVYGSIMTYKTWTWTWVNRAGEVVSGYRYTVNNYDSSLLYSPPPSFPFSGSEYQQLEWKSN